MKVYPQAVDIFLSKKDSTLYILKSFMGLDRFKIKTGVVESCSMFLDGAYDLTEDTALRKFASTFRSPFNTYIRLATDDFCSFTTQVANTQLGEYYTKLTPGPDTLVYFTSALNGFGFIRPNLSVKFVNPGNNSQFPSRNTLSIAVDNDGIAWIGCSALAYVQAIQVNDKGGLVEYSPAHGILKVYNTSNSGLRSDHVATVGVINNKVLVGTNNGLCVYTR